MRLKYFEKFEVFNFSNMWQSMKTDTAELHLVVMHDKIYS